MLNILLPMKHMPSEKQEIAQVSYQNVTWETDTEEDCRAG